MRLWILFSLLLMMVASSPSVDCKKSYNRIRKVLQELKTHGKNRKSISFERRGPPAPLCGACPAVAIPTNVSCATTWAPEFEPTEKGDCVCLKSYTCCPQNCPNISMDVCSENTTGNFFVKIGSDCCDCPTSTCVRCPYPVTPKDLTCDPCYHYEQHLTQHNESHCWESGCQKNAKIIYPDPGCDINCQTVSTVKDDCGNDRKICVDNSTPIGCQSAKPAEKQCFVSPKKVFLDKYFSSEGVCKKCWKWEITRKLEQCSQIFPLGESCPSAHKMITGVTTCGTQRDICLPIKATKPKCTACEEIKTVKDDYGFSVHTCIMKRCPSLSNLAGKECGPLKFFKDSCGCESIKCAHLPIHGFLPMKPFQSSSYFISTTSKTWDAARATCQNLGGDLAAFENDQEWDFVYPEVKRVFGSQNLWIGGRRSGGKSSGAVEWVGGETIGLGRKEWYSGQPNEKICLVMIRADTYSNSNSWHMDNGSCTNNNRFICEFK